MRSGWDCYGKKYSIQSKEGNGLGRKSKKFCGGTVVLLLFLGFFFLVAAKPSAFALGSQGHTLVTQKALNILKNTDSSLYTTFMTFRGRCPELPKTIFRSSLVPAALEAYYALPADTKLVKEAPAVDDYYDLEFVDVEGGIGSGGRDDPHKDEWDAIDDEPHYTEEGMNLTAFNHFIDIKKGPGLFDDYDGYSYNKGSASRDQYQSASDAASGTLAKLMGKITGFKVDEGINWWLNDEYVHAPGQQWYRGCSPSVERYSFPSDKRVYPTARDELLARFPVANSTGTTGRGIPYSVFMPVDNMARYWYGRFEATKDPATLGPVMHAIQDASVPHHAAGYMGNWHNRYEADLESRIPGWMNEPSFENEVKALVQAWSRHDPSPPTTLSVNEWSRQPAINWRIDQMVTWVALNAYKEYSNTYNHFRNGYRFDANSARNLTKLATAMSILALKKACGYVPGQPVQPAQTREDCINFDPARAEVKQVQGSWKIVVGDVWLLDFGSNESEARRALQIIQHYRMNSQCFVGRPNPPMQYYLVNGAAPSGALAGEDCIAFDPANIQVTQTSGTWVIAEGTHSIIGFGNNESLARFALEIIKKYGFNRICYVGRPGPSLVYFRK